MRREFTYVDDIVEGIVRTSDRPAASSDAWTASDPDPATSSAPYRPYNIGSHAPTALMELIGALESALGKATEKILLPMQQGDMPATYADIDDLARDTGDRPDTPLEVGIARYVTWFRESYG